MWIQCTISGSLRERICKTGDFFFFIITPNLKGTNNAVIQHLSHWLYFKCFISIQSSMSSIYRIREQQRLRLWSEIIRPQPWDRRSPLAHWLGASSTSPAAHTDPVCLSVKSEKKMLHLSVRQENVSLVLRCQPLNPSFQICREEQYKIKIVFYMKYMKILVF